MEINQKFVTYLNKRNIALAIIGVGIVISVMVYGGVFNKMSAKNAFEKAFFYRMVGNCESFAQYVVNTEYWNPKCLSEKGSGGIPPIKEFEILRTQYDKRLGKAFLQVSFIRDGEPYVFSYEMVKTEHGWQIANEP